MTTDYYLLFSSTYDFYLKLELSLIVFKRCLMSEQEPAFWQVKLLTEMTSKEWESLCDGCGWCCLNKIIDADIDEIHTTAIACRLLDLETCRCRHYKHRRKYVDDCIKFTPRTLHEHLSWLPDSCAYNLLYHGYNLPEWHPLNTGNQILSTNPVSQSKTRRSRRRKRFLILRTG